MHSLSGLKNHSDNSMQLTFEGDWNPEDAEAIALHLKKSLGMEGSSGLDELTPETISGDFPNLLSKRQKKLIGMLRIAGKKALIQCTDEDGNDCEQPPDWDEYQLGKGLTIGALKIGKGGQRYRLNQSKRWERVAAADSLPGYVDYSQPSAGVGAFQFPVEDGEFGRGIYFPVLPLPGGGLTIRVRLDLTPDELIDQDTFYDYERDLSQDTGLVLDSKGVKAIAKTEGAQVTLLMVRDRSEIEPMGILAGSGGVPSGRVRFNLVNLDMREDGAIADLEMLGDEPTAALSKSVQSMGNRSTLQSNSKLSGVRLVRTSAPALDRALVRRAVERCKTDGVEFEHIKVALVQGVPDFLPAMTHAFCLPSDRTVSLCPHDPQAAIAGFAGQLATRLQAAVRVGAIPGDVALEVLAKAAKLTPEWWLEMLIKRYVGAVLVADSRMLDGEPSTDWLGYINLLGGRGLAWWGNRRAIAECMAEDYRCAHDPDGLPNLITLEWDLACPAQARMCQQLLLRKLVNGDE
jgi:hypothetical protein